MKEVVVVKKICQIVFALLIFLVGSSSVGSAEHWISMPEISDDETQWFFDGDSAWFDSISRDGGVNEKCVWIHDHESSIVNIHFHLGANEVNIMYGQVRFYNGAGYQTKEFYDGRDFSFSNGTIGYEQIRRIANYARSK
ncbi:hypothetical protein [uncultured Selenomonas sp.]|uniref:hypothetical protein n=1 Tax=uncultured Selenomonas sp. TaxID=159275 RepID=UPI0025E8142D|nr:hypothetical protein [uncultured Selenomonas sp.]